MTKDDIISMAWEAGIRVSGPMDTLSPNNVYTHELHRFADLVAAAEREECIAELVEAAENLAKTFNQFSHGRSKEEDDLLAALAKIKE